MVPACINKSGYAFVGQRLYCVPQGLCAAFVAKYNGPGGHVQGFLYLAHLLRQARQQFDYILLDDPREEMCADRYYLVTTAHPAAIRGARRKADVLEVRGRSDTRLIVNAIDVKQMAALDLNVDDVMDEAGLGLMGVVPYDWSVTAACAAGKPLQGKKGAAAAANRIASRIQGIHTAIPSRL